MPTSSTPTSSMHSERGADTRPLTRAELEEFVRRARRTFGGDQCAYEATEDLLGLADDVGLR